MTDDTKTELPEDGTPLTVDPTDRYPATDDYYECPVDGCDTRCQVIGGVSKGDDVPTCLEHGSIEDAVELVPMKRRAFLKADPAVRRAVESQKRYLAELEGAMSEEGDGTGPAVPLSILTSGEPVTTGADDDAAG